MFRRLFWTSILLASLTACIPATATLLPPSTPVPDTVTPSVTPLPSLPENSPTPEVASPTLETVSPLPSATSTATESIPTKTPLPLPTFDLSPTPATTDVPQPAAEAGAIQIYAPGPLSKIVSPVVFYGYAVPGYGNKGRIELYGEDGRLLASQLLQLNTAYKWAYFSWELPFEVKAVGELGRLTMSVADQYGRVTALYSVHLLLLSEGFSIVNPPGDLRERCVIEQPVTGKRNSGSVLTVAGKIRPFNSQPLAVELVRRDGSVLGSQMVAISPASDGGYVPFEVDLPHSTSGGTWALLVVRQADDRIPGTMYLYSREIFLYP